MRFSRFCCTALLDRNFELQYCDDPFIFGRLLKGFTKLQKKLIFANVQDKFYKEFKVEGARYLVRAQRLLDHYILLRVSREIPKEIERTREMQRNFNDIRFQSDSMYDTMLMILNFLKVRDIASAEQGLKYLLRDSSDISAKCTDIIETFESSSNIVYHELLKELIQTRDIIRFAAVTKKGTVIKKRISFIFDVTPYYVKLDYRRLELSIYNLSKLAMILPRIGSLSSIEVSTLGDRFVNLYAKIPLQQNEPILQYRVEICTIKYIFRSFGGQFDFYEQDGFLIGSGYFETAFSDNPDLVAKTSRLIRNASIRELFDRQGNPKKYRPIYDNEEKKTFLHTPMEHWTEELDSRVRFARQFFEGIELEDEA